MCTQTPYRNPSIKDNLQELSPTRKLVKRSEVNPETSDIKSLFRENKKCPQCGDDTFVADMDEGPTRFCYNDRCKWKELVGSNGEDFQRDYFR